MKYNFYTIFDREFLAKGLVLYDSVTKHCPKNFNFFILCLDDTVYEILKKMNLPSVILLTLNDVENTELKEVRKKRTTREYSWTLKPSVANYIFINYPDIETVMYLDSDLYFYSSLEPIYEEFKGYSVLLFPHRLPEEKKEKENVVGKYNAGMLLFRNDINGRKCLQWWLKETNAWCHEIPEPEKYGDQKYLDFFEEQFEGVHVLTHKGVDVAPWNIKNYRGIVEERNNEIFLNGHKLINFHFSSLSLYYPCSRFLPSGPTNAYGYTRPSLEKKIIYDKYIKKVYESIRYIQKINPGFINGTLPRPRLFEQIKEMLILYTRAIKNKYLT